MLERFTSHKDKEGRSHIGIELGSKKILWGSNGDIFWLRLNALNIYENEA